MRESADVLESLEQRRHELTKSQRKVAGYILKNPMDVAFSTIDRLAHKVGTSTTTIVRLALFLGFSGYAEFQNELKNLLKNRMEPSVKLDLNIGDGGEQDGAVKEILDQQLANLNTTFNNIPGRQVTEAAGALAKAGVIYTIGYRSCFSVAHYLYYNLNRIFGRCTLLASPGGDVYEKVFEIGKEDVVVAISMPRYIKDVLRTVEIARERGAFVIAITDSPLSPLAEHADIVFPVECKSPDFHNSVFAAFLVAELLISVCTMANPDQARQNLRNAEAVLRRFDVHMVT